MQTTADSSCCEEEVSFRLVPLSQIFQLLNFLIKNLFTLNTISYSSAYTLNLAPQVISLLHQQQRTEWLQ